MKKKFYITTSIAYANAAPHIGFAMEVLQADALARYHRMLGEDVFFLSGTDENGAKMKKTAEEKSAEVQKFADENSARFQLLLDALNVSNNDFIRTTDKDRHWPAAQKVWRKLVEAGDIYEDSYEGYYCVGCETYLTEKDLLDGKCPNHQKKPEKVKEENYFFRLSKYSNQVQKKIESGELEILPEKRKREILNVIKSGLRDISFSRPKNILDWGVPVPDDETQTMYVWCDALTNYVSALGYGNDLDYTKTKNKNSVISSISEKSVVADISKNSDFSQGFEMTIPKQSYVQTNFPKYWPADVHIIGKDILRFHAAVWPAMLLSAKLPLPKKIFVHGFITSSGQKMSKSIGNVVDPFEIIAKYKSVDALRYYLLKEISSGGDGDFSYKRFEEVYQADLANGLGNLVARVLAMAEKTIFNFQFSIFNQSPIFNFQTTTNKTWENYENALNNFRLNEALNSAWEFIGACDKYIEENKPWKMRGEDKAKVIYNLLESLRHIAWMTWPFLPETSMKIFEQLFAEEKERAEELSKDFKKAQRWGKLKPVTKIKKGAVLFPRLV